MQTSKLEQHDSAVPFKVIKRNGLVLTSDVIDLMKGTAVILHVKRAASQETCEQIVRNFDSSDGVMQRSDGVAGNYIGSSHYRKNSKQYFHESVCNRAHINHLLGDVLDPFRAVYSLLDSKLKEIGGHLKLASSSDGKANYCRALCWTGSGHYALEPHEDMAQVEHAEQNFEFSKVAKHEVIAMNFYPSMPKLGGDLRVWDFKPSSKQREHMGLAGTGYPYDEASLQGKEYWDLGVSAGDLVFINGGYVHAVTQQSSEGRRILLHAFVGFVNSKEAVWWT